MRLPSEVLSLGARIVRELELDESTNTLSRWMAHHLAETMKSAEVADEANKERLEEKAVSLILELWANRRDLPGNAYPLAKLGEAIAVLNRLHSVALPFRRQSTNELEDLLWRVFNALQVVVIHGTLVATRAGNVPDDFESQTTFLTEEENYAYDVLKDWIGFRGPENLRLEILTYSEGEEYNIDSLRSRIAELNELEPAARSGRILTKEIEGLMETLTILKSRVSDGGYEVDAES